MSSKRAKQHKKRTHYVRLVREHLNEVNRGGLFDKRLNNHQRNPHKFRRRAYYREKEHDDRMQGKTDLPGLLQFVNPPAGWQPLTTKENKQ